MDNRYSVFGEKYTMAECETKSREQISVLQVKMPNGDAVLVIITRFNHI